MSLLERTRSSFRRGRWLCQDVKGDFELHAPVFLIIRLDI
jgi:hypothetical protein